MAAIVEGDDPPSVARQRLDPAGRYPIDRDARPEAVDEQDRLAVALSSQAISTPSD